MPRRDDAIPPHDEAAEAGVLGSMLCDDAVIDIALEALEATDFYTPRHRVVFEVMARLHAAGGFDFLTVESELLRAGMLERAGGQGCVGRLIERTPTAANIEKYCRLVREATESRSLLDIAHKLHARLDAPGEENTADWLEAEISKVQARRAGVSSEPVELRELASEIGHAVLTQPERDFLGLRIGMADGALDDLFGIEPSKLIVLAARTSVGKTTFCLGLAGSVHRFNPNAGCPLIISTENTQYSMARAALAAAVGVPVRALAKRNLTVAQRAALEGALESDRLNGIHFAYMPGKSIAQVRAVAKRHKARHGLPLLIVDLAGRLKSHGETEREQLASISAGLSELKGELDTCIIATVQLSRSVFMNSDRRPELHHLKGTGAWEEDADRILFLHRPGYFEGSDPRTEIIQAKDRDFGDVRSVWVTWQRATGRFVRAENEAAQIPLFGGVRV